MRLCEKSVVPWGQLRAAGGLRECFEQSEPVSLEGVEKSPRARVSARVILSGAEAKRRA